MFKDLGENLLIYALPPALSDSGLKLYSLEVIISNNLLLILNP